MKIKSVFLLGTVLALSAHFWALRADEVVPKKAGFTRYQALLTNSPFAVATAAAPVAAAPDFARDLYIANAAHSETGDLVTLASTTDNNFKKYLTTTQADDGYAISHIDWSDRIGETKVTISKDGQFATLSFNQALLSQPLPRTAPPMKYAPGNPAAMQGNPIGRLRPAPVPMLPTPPPHLRGTIKRAPTNFATPPVRKPPGRR